MRTLCILFCAAMLRVRIVQQRQLDCIGRLSTSNWYQLSWRIAWTCFLLALLARSSLCQSVLSSLIFWQEHWTGSPNHDWCNSGQLRRTQGIHISNYWHQAATGIPVYHSISINPMQRRKMQCTEVQRADCGVNQRFYLLDIWCDNITMCSYLVPFSTNTATLLHY